MDQAVLDGITLEYENSGTGEPVICIHGAFIADTFRPQLSERSIASVKITQPVLVVLGERSVALHPRFAET